MLKLSLRMTLAGWRRLLAAGLAVLAGVGFMAGTLVLTDTVAATFRDTFASMNAGTDAVVRGAPAGPEFGGERGPVAAGLTATVAAVDGVAAAEPRIQGPVQLLDERGRPLTTPGPTSLTLGANWPEADRLNPFTLVAGHAPGRDGEVVIDRASAELAGYTVGDSAAVLDAAGRSTVQIAGIARSGAADGPAGGTWVLFTRAAAERHVGQPGRVAAIALAAEPGVSETDLRDRVARVVPAGVEVVTGGTIGAEDRRAAGDLAGLLSRFLLTFALVALFVGSFIIHNTFSIAVAQRGRELALLRALGATRRQVLRSVLVEAAVVGLAAGLAGVIAGIGVAVGLKGLLAAFGFTVPAAGVLVTPRTVEVALLTGLVVSVAAAFLPARRAARVAPLAALREVAVDTSGRSRRRLVAGLLTTLAGGGAVLLGLLSGSDGALPVVGLGGAVLFVGVTVLGPVIAGPVSRALGAPLAALGGMPGRLARANALRQPKRTAGAAAALMVAVSLVGFATIVAASSKVASTAHLDRTFTADYTVEPGPFGAGLPPGLTERLDALPEVKAAAATRQGLAVVDGARVDLVGIDPPTFAEVSDLGVSAGRLADLDGDGIAVRDTLAAAKGWSVGDRVGARFADTGPRTLTVAAVYRNGDVVGDHVVGLPVFEANLAGALDGRVLIDRAAGVGVDEARTAIERVVADYPSATLLDQDQLERAQSAQIDQVLNFVYILLALAVVVALLGIANTLSLATLERTRELGLLRAVGMTRRQVRASVRLESVIVALLGTVLGTAVAVFLGWAMVTTVAGDGATFVVPAIQLGAIALAAALAGVLAAVLPARRAARLDVLAAVATE